MKDTKNINDKILSNAQYKKSLSIAFFNAMNAAISLVSPATQDLTPEEIQNRVKMYRDYFLEEHKTYYAAVIANVGQNYKAEDSIAKLKAVKSLGDLQTAWVLLSEDERRDVEIRKVAGELKKKYSNEKN